MDSKFQQAEKGWNIFNSNILSTVENKIYMRLTREGLKSEDVHSNSQNNIPHIRTRESSYSEVGENQIHLV